MNRVRLAGFKAVRGRRWTRRSGLGKRLSDRPAQTGPLSRALRLSRISHGILQFSLQEMS